ncbi:MAG TPA: META domain-containing protein [Actinopolymorphaceae bacterium]
MTSSRWSRIVEPAVIRAAAAGLIAAVAATACGTETLEPRGETADLGGRTYLSTKASDDGRARGLVPGTRISLTFTKDDRLIAHAGCNTMTGPVSIADGRLVLGAEGLAVTEMGCDAERHAQDEWLSRLLTSKPSVEARDDSLAVESESTRVELVDREVVDPDRPVEGTRWTLTTVIEQETASSTPTGEDQVFVEFGRGRVTGSDGCNRFTGKAVVGDRSIELGSIVSTEKACVDPQAARVQRHVNEVLTGEVDYEVEARTLTLHGANGVDLQFSAER